MFVITGIAAFGPYLQFCMYSIMCLVVQLTLAHSALFTPLRREPRKEQKPLKKTPGESDAENGSETPRRDAKGQADARGARNAAAADESPRAKSVREAGAHAAASVSAPKSSTGLELHSELFDWCSKHFLGPLLSVPASNDPESLANCNRRTRYQINAHVDELGIGECASLCTFEAQICFPYTQVRI